MQMSRLGGSATGRAEYPAPRNGKPYFVSRFRGENDGLATVSSFAVAVALIPSVHTSTRSRLGGFFDSTSGPVLSDTPYAEVFSRRRTKSRMARK